MSANRSTTPDIAGIRNLHFLVNLFNFPCFASRSKLVFSKGFGIKKKERERERRSNILREGKLFNYCIPKSDMIFGEDQAIV